MDNGNDQEISTARVRFYSKFKPENGKCHIWQGSKSNTKYGKRANFWFKGKTITAARAVFILNGLDIPKGMVVCHTCDNPQCVNIEHLYIGTYSDNNSDTVKRNRYNNQNTKKTHCLKGHEFTENNILASKRGSRQCKTCHRINTLAAYHKKRTRLVTSE